jgi:urea transporter/murein DD-endopeptidase MepM/ murein hydrolase activator NlpD
MTGAISAGLRNFGDSILYSYAQILFSNRRWFGALLLAVMFIKPQLGILALLGVTISNLAAYVLKFDSGRIRSGFYGFNGVLFGAAFGFYFEVTPLLLALFPIFVVITFLISAALEHHLATTFNLPGLSLPFIIALHILLVFVANYEGVTARVLWYSDPGWMRALPVSIQTYFHSLALIFFQTDIAAGVLISLGILLFSRVMFVLSIVGFISSTLFVTLLLPGKPESFILLAGFNGILAAMALGGCLVIPSRKSLLLALLAVLMVVIFAGFFTRAFFVTRLPVFVLPFNAVVLATLYSLKFRQKSSGLVLLYFAPGSPEENYYYHHTNQARFERLRYFMPDLPFLGEWTVTQGHNGNITHKEDWRHAWDFVVTDERALTFSNSGSRLEDYYCYKLPVIAPLDGEVALVVDSIPNNRIGDMNLAQNWGNTIILNHGEGLYSAFSHLEPNSSRVTIGARVKRGEILALCGSSGRSPEPHLHFQFQATDKLGDKTISHPFGCFLEDKGDGYVLVSSAFPAERSRLQNLMEHRLTRDAFRFQYGNRYDFECQFEDGLPIHETWEVKVDIYNSLYLESSAEATITFLAKEKVFYLTDFRGNHKSALYYFYLSALQVPMTFHSGLTWTDVFPLAKVYASPIRYLAETLLLISKQITADVNFRFEESNGHNPELIIHSLLTVAGKGLFSHLRKQSRGRLSFSSDGIIKSLDYFRGDQQVFRSSNSPAAIQ